MDDLKSEKRKIRYKFLILRNKIMPNVALVSSVNIFTKIQNIQIYNEAKIVMFYISCGSEVITDNMINSAISEGKTVAVPALKFSNFEYMKMYAVKISQLSDASQFIYGIRQPEIIMSNVIEQDNIDLIFVPGLIFDIRGYRIGYGKGCYDMWLSKSHKKTIGLAYDFQVIDKLPNEKYDIPVGSVITEKRIICI
ncbi:MAG: 5-formyltetrahydrofolate cyclo-ligase [Endomicrobium sp.]|jgi:5-formyltetrahydrofolate cyclo-ligase|nr:5-formyltetrahydrofolate cyclo-ligase [Endomicrobium sp.]